LWFTPCELCRHRFTSRSWLVIGAVILVPSSSRFGYAASCSNQWFEYLFGQHCAGRFAAVD
jgi:hypothetical protein